MGNNGKISNGRRRRATCIDDTSRPPTRLFARVLLASLSDIYLHGRTDLFLLFCEIFSSRIPKLLDTRLLSAAASFVLYTIDESRSFLSAIVLNMHSVLGID